MSLVPIDESHITSSIVNDAQWLRGVLDYAQQRYNVYNQNLTTAAMTTAGIDTADQNFVLAFIGDLNRIIQLSEGTLPTNADNMTYNINGLLGLQ